MRLRLTGQDHSDFDKSNVQGIGLEWAGEQMGDLETASTTLLRCAFREENREVTEGGGRVRGARVVPEMEPRPSYPLFYSIGTGCH